MHVPWRQAAFVPVSFVDEYRDTVLKLLEQEATVEYDVVNRTHIITKGGVTERVTEECLFDLVGQRQFFRQVYGLQVYRPTHVARLVDHSNIPTVKSNSRNLVVKRLGFGGGRRWGVSPLTRRGRDSK